MVTAHAAKVLAWQAVKYGLTGFVNTGISVSLMVAGAALGLHYAVYTAIAYLAGLLVSFTLNLRFTFRAEGRLWRRFQGFLAVCLACLALAQAVQAFLIEGLGISELVGVGSGMVTYTVIGFFLNRRFVFGALDAAHHPAVGEAELAPAAPAAARRVPLG